MKWSEQQTYIRKVYAEWERFVASGNSEGLTVRPEVTNYSCGGQKRLIKLN